MKPTLPCLVSLRACAVVLLGACAVVLLGACAVVLLGACASTPSAKPTATSQREVLREEQALQVIQEALVQEGTASERSVPITVEDREELVVDLRLLESVDPPGAPAHQAGFAIEWVSDKDRADHADVLPQGTPDGPLRIVTGKRNGQTAQVLVLDASAYGYEVNPELVQRGAPGLTDAEERVRRDVVEFLEYARSQGAQ